METDRERGRRSRHPGIGFQISLALMSCPDSVSFQPLWPRCCQHLGISSLILHLVNLLSNSLPHAVVQMYWEILPVRPCTFFLNFPSSFFFNVIMVCEIVKNIYSCASDAVEAVMPVVPNCNVDKSWSSICCCFCPWCEYKSVKIVQGWCQSWSSLVNHIML